MKHGGIEGLTNKKMFNWNEYTHAIDAHLLDVKEDQIQLWEYIAETTT